MSEKLNEKLGKLIEFLKANNEYYSEIFKEYGEDLRNIPFLTSQLIRLHGLAGTKKMISKNLKIGYIFSTGGTTGKPKFICYTFDEFEIVVDLLCQCYQFVEENDIVANLFMAGNMWASFIFVNKVLQKRNCSILPISGTTNIELIKNYIEFFKPNCIVGIPTQIMQVISKDYYFLKKVLFAGELFTQNQLKFLYDMSCLVRSAGYASVDADVIGYQCIELKINQHHVFTEHQIVELIDLESDESIAEEDRVGQIVVTNLDRFLNPVVRYKTGDLGKWVRTNCGCDKPTIELLGRFDDWIRLASYDFYYQDFANVFYPLNIALKINRNESKVTVLIEKTSEELSIDYDEMIEKLKKENWQLREGIEEKLIKVEFEFVSSLPKTNKKIKVVYE